MLISVRRLVIVLLLLSACKSKKITTQTREVTKIDTVYRFKDRIIDRPVIDSIIIDKPCDSLGNIRPFTGVLKTNHTKVSVKAEKGEIRVIYNQDSIITALEEKYRARTQTKTEIKEKEIIRYRWPWWVIYLIGYSALVTLGCGYLLIKRFV